jgi:hypothetical protein
MEQVGDHAMDMAKTLPPIGDQALQHVSHTAVEAL